MFFMLNFDPLKISRATTRAQWREMHRWLRVAQKRIAARMAEQEELQQRMLADLAAYGTTKQRLDYAERLINPPMSVVSPPFAGGRIIAGM